MTTGSWCLTEIFRSVNPCSSNSEASQSADSTSASAVALPYLASSRLSSEPALTPIRIGVPAADAARAISATLSSNALMLPGLTRTAPQPASMAANTYRGWKWMSAMTGICDLRAISGTASRTIWQPAAVSSAICCRVAFTSAVGVVVIDCTETGAPPPTGTAFLPLPTTIWRDFRRGARAGSAGCGMPRSTVIGRIASLGRVDGVSLERMHGIDDIRCDQQHGKPHQNREHPDAQRYQLLHVHQAGIRPAEHPRQPGPDPLEDHYCQVAAVQRQQWQQVERADEDIQGDDQQKDFPHLGLPADAALRHRLSRVVCHPDHAAQVSGRGMRPVLGEKVGQR